MEQSTQAAEEMCVDEFTGALPFEVGVVQAVVSVQFVQELCQMFGGLEIVYMDVTVFWCTFSIIFWPGSHHYWKNIPTNETNNLKERIKT